MTEKNVTDRTEEARKWLTENPCPFGSGAYAKPEGCNSSTEMAEWYVSVPEELRTEVAGLHPASNGLLDPAFMDAMKATAFTAKLEQLKNSLKG